MPNEPAKVDPPKDKDLPKFTVMPLAALNMQLEKRESTSRIRIGYLMFATVISTIGSFSKMDYNLPIFLFELVRDRYFYDVRNFISEKKPK